MVTTGLARRFRQMHHMTRSGQGRGFMRGLLAFAIIASLLGSSLQSTVAQDGAAEPSLLGNFTVVISIPDVQRDIANGPALYGRWQISFRVDGTYGAERADLVGELITGSFVIEGDQVTITDEGGLLSCANASIVGHQPDSAVGVYRWERNDDRLSMVPIDDDCAGRRILLSTRQLTGFAPCATQPLNLSAAASPIAQAPPVADAPDEATPVANGSVEDAIDELLSQMTSCWATGQPEFFLPLLTESYRSDILRSGTTGDPVSELAALMAATPFVWQRTGGVDMIDERNATALVRQAVNNQEDFVRYAFAFEDGQWRWNGAG